jgi:hypothetical protein
LKDSEQGRPPERDYGEDDEDDEDEETSDNSVE